MNKSSVMIYDVPNEYNSQLNSILQEVQKVYFVENEEEAFLYLLKDRVDLVITNQDSKYLDDLLKFIELNKCHVPIACITSSYDSDEVTILYEKGIADVFVKPFSEKLLKIKVKNLISNKWFRYNLNGIMLNREDEIAKSRGIIIIAMSILAESRDGNTGQHILQMQKVTSIIARKYKELFPKNLTEKELEEIILFSPLHDIGKISIPDTVLKKPGKFSLDDMEVMKDHTVLGGSMLFNTQRQLAETQDLLRVAIEIAKYHHEKYDGSGYPCGLAGEEIPLSARIVAVADVYDALLSPRIYKKGFKHEDVVKMILVGDDKMSPSQFDPKVLEAFAAASEELKQLL